MFDGFTYLMKSTCFSSMSVTFIISITCFVRAKLFDLQGGPYIIIKPILLKTFYVCLALQGEKCAHFLQTLSVSPKKAVCYLFNKNKIDHLFMLEPVIECLNIKKMRIWNQNPTTHPPSENQMVAPLRFYLWISQHKIRSKGLYLVCKSSKG